MRSILDEHDMNERYQPALNLKRKPQPQQSRRKKNARSGQSSVKIGMHRRHNKRSAW